MGFDVLVFALLITEQECHLVAECGSFAVLC